MQLQTAKPAPESQKYTMKILNNSCSIATGKPLCLPHLQLVLGPGSNSEHVVEGLLSFWSGWSNCLGVQCWPSLNQPDMVQGLSFEEPQGLGRHHTPAWLWFLLALHGICPSPVSILAFLIALEAIPAGSGHVSSCCMLCGQQKAQAAIPRPFLGMEKKKCLLCTAEKEGLELGE